MTESNLVVSPACQITPRAVVALEQATADELLEVGAFMEMGHLPVGRVLADALRYAAQLLRGPGAAPDPVMFEGLADRELMPPDVSFLSQLLALRDVAAAHGIAPAQEQAGEGAGPGAAEGVQLSLADLMVSGRDRFVARAQSWQREPGRKSAGFRVQVGEGGLLWPLAVAPSTTTPTCPDPERDADGFVLFAVLPLLGPFLALEDDCFVAPRLE